MRRLLLSLLAGSALLGCNAIFGIEVLDERVEGSGGSADGGGGDGGAGADGTGGSGAGTGGSTNCVDNDSDGVSTCADDCDDEDENRYPGNTEICGDGIDQNCNGVPDDTCVLGAYVSATLGDDTYPGTEEYPVATITKGISNAATLGEDTVTVGEGTYDEVVTLQSGISVLGGHRCNSTKCDFSPDADAFVSTIDAPTAPAVIAQAGVSRTTELAGFTIRGPESITNGTGVTATVSLEDASPVVLNNHIFGPGVSCNGYCVATAVAIDGNGPDDAGALLTSNTIVGAESTAAASGVEARGAAEIIGNKIALARGGSVFGVRAEATGDGTVILVRGNDIGSGTCTQSGGYSHGLEVSSDLNATIRVERNQINYDPTDQGDCGTCTASSSCGGMAILGGDVTVVNNIIMGIENAPNTHALYVSDGEGDGIDQVTIHSNTLMARGSSAGTTSAAVRLDLISGTTLVAGVLRNNILNGGDAPQRFGIHEREDSDEDFTLSIVENNEFQDVDVMWRRWSSNTITDFLTSDDVNLNGSADDNVALSCALTSTLRLAASSACIDLGTSSGAPNEDIDGDSRPQGPGGLYDIGADEAD